VASSGVSVSVDTGTKLLSITLPAGTWVISACASFSANGAGRRQINIYTTSGYSNVGINSCPVQVPAVSDSSTCISSSAIIQITSSVTYYLNVYQNSGSSLTVSGMLSAVKIK
jgi:hypothetical protein